MKSLAINALRQIEKSAGKGIWDAHRGCGAIAGALLVHDGLARGAAASAIEARALALLNSEDEAPIPTTSISRTAFTKHLLGELAIAAEVPKEIGHDVIYSAYVLRALDVFNIDPWSSLLDAIVTLIRKVITLPDLQAFGRIVWPGQAVVAFR